MSEEFSSTTDGVTISINETPDVVIVLNEQGPAGGPGPVGPQGPAGPAGPVGPQGEQGPRGETALTFAVGTTTTVEPDEVAKVENVGTGQDIVLNFEIPQGVQGIQGTNGKGVDIGTIITSLSSTAPEGFAPCNGTGILKTNNPELWEAVAYTEKEGDGVLLHELPMVGDWNTLPWVEPKDTSAGGDMVFSTKPLKSSRVPFNSQAIQLNIGQEFALMGDDCCIVWACSNDNNISNGEGDPENTVIKVTKAKSSGYLGVATSSLWSEYYPAQTHNNNWMIVDNIGMGTYSMYMSNRIKYDSGYTYNDIVMIAQWDGIAGHPIKVLFANPYIEWADMGTSKLPVINNSTVTSGGCKDYYRLVDSTIAEYNSSVVNNVVRTNITFNDVKVLGMYGANSSGYLNKNIGINGLEINNLWTASAGTGDTRVIIVDDNGDFVYNPRHNASNTTSEILFTGDRSYSSPNNSYYTGGGTKIWFYNTDCNTLLVCERESISSDWGPWHVCPGYAIVANLTANTSNVVSVSKFATTNISPLSEFTIEMRKNNGNCGYFGLDYIDKYIKLPVLNQIFLEGYNSSNSIGGYIQDQIVNIKGMVQAGNGGGGATGGGSGMFRAGATGAFYVDDQMQYLANAYLADNQPSGAFYRNLLFNASRQVNTGDRVKPRSISVYFYVCVSKYTNMERGPVYTPSVSEDGILSWTNNGDLVNPDPVSIRGPQGEKGSPGEDGIDGQQGPIGPANVLTIGTVVQGLEASATITGESPNQVLNLVLPQGADGDTATITVGSTNTLPAGSNATVVNSGTSSAAVLNFSIPRGDTGAPGQTGADGVDGYSPSINVKTSTDEEYILTVTNKEGSYDTPNLIGPKGNKGDKGDAAFTLNIGSVTTGEAGGSANVVNVGTTTDQIWNITIPQGIKGDKGEQGDRGLTGPEGPQGPQGNEGQRGPQGVQGNPGPANTLTIGTVQSGDTASASITGVSPNQTLNLTLPKGEKGDKGDTGETGPQGATGPQGEQGIKGDTGEQGLAGFSPTIEINTNTASTYTLDITDSEGTITTPNLIGPQGEQGVQGPQGLRGDAISQTYTNVTATSGELIINLVDSIPVYHYVPLDSNPVTISFDTSSLGGGQIITFEMWVECSVGAPTITWPVILSWLNGVEPAFSTGGRYIIAFRSYNNGATWIGSYQGSY